MGLKPFRAFAPMFFSRRYLPFARPSATPELVLDLSRLLSRAFLAAPTGIDRVEMAWARGLARRVPDRLRYAALHPAGHYYGRLDPDAVARFLDFTEDRWRTGIADRRAAVRHLWALRPRPVPPSTAPRLYLKPSPDGLEDQRLARAILRREGARLVCLVHDLIPLTHPEYARPHGAETQRRRLATLDALADTVLTNSHDTLEILRAHLTGPRLAAAPLGIDPVPAVEAPPAPGRAYFLCVATIEPRKNHLLLLTLWRRLAETRAPADIPRLILVGRRGWENENVLDLLDRSPAIAAHVEERGPLGDRELAPLMTGARALLLPSFAEGFGLPVAEALAAGCPVLCSDLPALREAGGHAPDYLDPLDGRAWAIAIEDYARPASPARAAQLARLADWRPPTWDQHIDKVLEILPSAGGAAAYGISSPRA